MGPPKVLRHEIDLGARSAKDPVYSGPTLIGLGPKTVDPERTRPLELEPQVKQALGEIDGFLRILGR